MDPAARYRVNKPSIVNEIIDGEAVMINLDSGSYYSADKTGAAVWEALAEGASLPEACAFVAERFAGEPAAIEKGVAAFVERLLAEGLMVVDSARVPGPLPPAPGGSPTSAFEPPTVQRYDDMKDLLLSDPIHDVDASGWPNLAPGKKAE